MSNQNGSNGSAPAELARVLTLDHLFFMESHLSFRSHSLQHTES